MIIMPGLCVVVEGLFSKEMPQDTFIVQLFKQL